MKLLESDAWQRWDNLLCLCPLWGCGGCLELACGLIGNCSQRSSLHTKFSGPPQIPETAKTHEQFSSAD